MSLRAFVLITVFVGIALPLANAEDVVTCVAMKETEVSYSSAMWHQVVCSDRTEFEAGLIFTSILIPLPPFNWTERSEQKMYDQMAAEGFDESGRLVLDNRQRQWQRVNEKTVQMILFSNAPTKRTLCVQEVLESVVEVDIEGRELLKYNLRFACTDGTQIQTDQPIEKRNFTVERTRLGLTFLFETPKFGADPILVFTRDSIK